MGMKHIFVIGGMGAGKSSVTRLLAAQGLPPLDLDELGHSVLSWDVVKRELKEAFGEDVLTEGDEVNRHALATHAFSSEKDTQTLNRITQPRIVQALCETLAHLESEGNTAAVIESSSFTGQPSLRALADCIIAVGAPLELRVQRAVAAGWREEDVRARIAHQLTDEQRARFADVIFVNDGSFEQLSDKVTRWWNKSKDEFIR